MRIDEVMAEGGVAKSDSIPTLLENFAAQWDDLPPPGPIVMFGHGSTGGGYISRYVDPVGWSGMWAAGPARPVPGQPWGFDNGAWVAFYDGADSFPEETFLERLEVSYEYTDEIDTPPLVAVTPDKVRGGMESLEFSLEWIRSGRLPEDWPWYLALQDDMEFDAVKAVLDEFDGLFLGGSNRFKATARKYVELADRNNLPFHYGRAGTMHAVDLAFDWGITSIDSAGPMKSVLAMRRFLSHFAIQSRQHPNYRATHEDR